MDDAVIRLEEQGEPLGEALVYRHSSPPPLSGSASPVAAAASLGPRLRVRIAHWGRGEGVGDETESAITRSVFLVQQHNSQRSLLRFVIVARCYGVSTGPRACAHTHPSPVSFVTRCFERARSQPGHVANQIAAGRRCAVLPPSPSAFGRALRGRRGACESCTHLAVPSSAVRQAC